MSEGLFSGNKGPQTPPKTEEKTEEKNVSIGIWSRRKAIETLKEALRTPHSKLSDNIKRAHHLLVLLKERRDKEGADVASEIAEVEKLKERLETGSSNQPRFGKKDRKAA